MTFRRVVVGDDFNRAYKKFIKHNARLKKKIDLTIQRLEEDAFAQSLGTHKLIGNLYGLFACSCGYDCRIVFSLDKVKNEEVITLIDIGTHDDVY